MLKRIFTATRIVTAVLLVVSVFAPATVAEASGTITKTVTVLGPDGNPYAGAVVALGYPDKSTGTELQSWTQPLATTNSSGVATLTFSDAITSGTLFIEPLATDTSTAIFTDGGTNYATSSPVTVTLEKAAFSFESLKWNGDSTPAGGIITNGYKAWYQLIRQGAVGVPIPSTAVEGRCTPFYVMAPDLSYDAFRTAFATKATGSGSSRVVKVYSDFTTCNNEAPKVNGVYQLKLNKGNITGFLKTNVGGALTIPSGKGYSVQVEGVSADGSSNYGASYAYAFVQSNGAFTVAIDTSTAGTYHLSFGGFGDVNYPSFSAGNFYVTADHKLSWNADGSGASTSLAQNFNIPLKNISFGIVDSATGLNQAVNISFEKLVPNSTNIYSTYAPYVNSDSAAIGAYLTDGDYRIRVGSPYFWSNLNIRVSGSTVTVLSSDSKPYTRSGNDFTYWNPAPNVKFKVVDSANNPVPSSIDLCSTECFNGSTDATGAVSMYVGNGTFGNINVVPSGNANFGAKKLSGTVTAGVATITGATLNGNNEWVVVVPASNIKYKVLNERSGARLQGYAQVFTANSNWSKGSYFGQATFAANALGGAYFPDGNYLVEVNPFAGQPDNDGLATRQYRLTVAGSALTLTYNGVAVSPDSSGIYTLYPSAANLDVIVKDSSGNLITSGQAEIWDTESNGSRTNQRWAQITSTGHVYASVRNGSTSITVRPAASYTNASMKKFSITTTNDVPVVTGGTLSGSAWILVSPAPNVRVVVKNAITNTPLANAWVEVQNSNDSWDQLGWIYNLDINSDNSGNARANLANGKYLFIVNPSDTVANAGLASQTYRVTINESGTAISLGATAVTAVDGIFPLNPASSNFDIIAKKADGTLFSNGWIEYCKTDSAGNRTFCNGIWLRTDGTQSRYLTDGTWQVILHPGSGNNDVSDKTYNVTVTAGSIAVTGLTVGGDGKWTLLMGTPNVSGTFTTASGALTFANDEGISLQIQKKDVNGNWQWQNGGMWVNTTAWALNMSGAGQYRLVANPYNFDDLVQSYSGDIWIDSSNKFSTTQNGTYTDTLTALTILMKTPNLKLTVVNPLNNDELVAGGWVEIQKINGNNRNWIGNADISVSNPGITGFNITETGNYVLKVNPPQGTMAIPGVASREYQLTVSALDSLTVTSGGIPVTISNGRSVLKLATANVTARILRPDGTAASNSNSRSYYVNLQKLNQWNNWDWINKGSSVDSNGSVSFRVDAAGTYRLRIEPYNDPTASVTYSTTFTVADNQIDTLDKKFGNLTMNPPSLRVSVATPGAPNTILSNINIEVRKDGNWIDWAYTSQSGVAGITLTSEGTYELVPNPSQELQGVNSKKSYKFTATKNSDGQIVATPVVADGASTGSDGVVKLLLGLPTLSGTVKDPTGSTVLSNAHVWAQNTVTGQDLWNESAWTNNNGAWSMSLPAGTYKIYSDAPSQSLYGKSNPIGDVVVATNGSVTVPGGYTANAFEIRLKNPTWSGTIKDPTGATTIPNARVCLLVSNYWNCANADSAGHWALSMSDAFTSFTGTNPVLDISDDYGRAYPTRRIQGESAVSAALGATGSTNVELRLQASNVQITVVTPDSTKIASNLWVVAERDGVGYLGSGTTDSTGLVKLNIADPTVAFKLRVDVNGNSDIAANFAPLMTTFTSSEIATGTTSGVFRSTVTLPTPNFKFIVREPNDAGNPVPYAWVELISGNDGAWLGGASTDANGFANFKLDVPSSGLVNNYTVTVNPLWNATTNWTRQGYAVAVASSGAITVVNKTSIASVSTQVASGKTVFPLLLGVPSVTGVVVDPSNNGVANSWVVPQNAATNEYYWQQGVSSRQNGQLAMNLASGSYKLEANVPWGTSGLAKSAKCDVTVANGTISTGGSCVQAGTPNTVKIQLRLPNVKFTLKIGSTPIANANVSVGAGSWWTNAQSNEQGVVSLFIDADAIRAANTWNTGSIRLYFWIDPPYGSSTMARWSCYSTENKPLCKDLTDVPATGDYVGNTSPSWEVQGVQPNTRLKIVAPGTSNDLANSWVSIYAINSNGYKWWLNGGNSGNDGYVAINIETATAYSYGYTKLGVEVQAPWNDRSRYATNLYSNNDLGYTFESLTAIANFSPALPNLTLKIKGANGYDNRYGWYNVAEVDGSNNITKWIGGYGLNESGDGAVYLPGNKRYKLFAYPGGGRPGVQTSCILTTNSATPPAITVVSCEGTNSLSANLLTLRLAGGNVVGTVLGSDGKPLAGAAVYANQPGAATEATAIITITDETGHYDLQLTGGMSWTITVFPVPTANETLPSKSLASPFTAPNTGQPVVTKDFSYVAS